MGINRGKLFEDDIREALLRVPDISLDRMYDQMSGFKGSTNICDFIAYHCPNQFYFECKSCYGNTLSINSNDPKRRYGDISNAQWEGLLKKSEIPGVTAGYFIWFIDHDMTLFVSAQTMKTIKDAGNKSFNINHLKYYNGEFYIVPGKKKRVRFDYDLIDFIGG